MTGPADDLHADLRAALGMLDAAVAGIAPVVGLGYPGYRVYAYRVDLADGRVVKARLFTQAGECERTEYVARCLGPCIVTQPLARFGTALVTEWAEGVPPAQSDAVLRRCGALLARAHNTPLPHDAPSIPRLGLDTRWQRLRDRAAHLAQAGVLTHGDVATLLDIAQRSAPSVTTTTGFVLHDFTAQNIIVGAADDPILIDHDGLNIGTHDFDLARTWYRWPLPAAQLRCLLAGYASLRDIEPFLTHFPYWAVDALVAALKFRLSRDIRGTAEPLTRLRGLFAVSQRGLPAREALYHC
jgi:aminoglycoside phosphotransferase (APT) family kinase protein